MFLNVIIINILLHPDRTRSMFHPKNLFISLLVFFFNTFDIFLFYTSLILIFKKKKYKLTHHGTISHNNIILIYIKILVTVND